MGVGAGTQILWYPYYATSAQIRDKYCNYNGVVAVWNNPNMYDGGESGNRPMQTTVPYTIRYRKSQANAYTPTQWTLKGDYNIRASDQSKIATDAYNTGAVVQGLTGVATGYQYAPKVNAGDAILASHFNTIEWILGNISSLLTRYDGWFDANGVCSRSCQLTCQVGCQVYCQNCVNGLCHDQNCGIS